MTRSPDGPIHPMLFTKLTRLKRRIRLSTGTPELAVMGDRAFHGNGRQGGSGFASLSRSRCRHLAAKSLIFLFLGLLFAASAAIPLSGRAKKDSLAYGEGLIVNIPLPEPEVAQVVEEIAQNT